MGNIKQLLKSQNILPQIPEPYTEVIKLLKSNNIEYKSIMADTAKLRPLQGIIFADDIHEYIESESSPIYISNEYDVVDGHHRLGSAIAGDKKIKTIMINLNTEDCIKELTRIQHILDHKNLESNNKEFNVLDSIKELPNNRNNNSNIKVSGYRNTPINDKSETGNFFHIKPNLDDANQYMKYNIEFDNLFDTDDIGLNFDGNMMPNEKLAKVWFPYLNIDKIVSEHGFDKNSLINKMLHKHANDMGYDGIKYSDIMLHSFK